MRLTPPEIILTVLLLFGVGNFLVTTTDLAPYPYDLDYSEGFVVEDVQRLLETGQLYPEPMLSNGFESVKYPPVFYLVMAGIGAITGNSLVTGRILSLFATLLVMAVMLLFVRQRTGTWRHPVPFLFLVPFVTLFTATTVRTDMLALAFSLFGLYTFHIGRRGASILFFLLAFLTKHSFVAGVLAALLTLTARLEWRSLLSTTETDTLREVAARARPVLRYGGMYATGLALTLFLIHGWADTFLQNVFLANFGGFEVRYDLLRWVAITFPPLFVLSGYYVYRYRDTLLGGYLFFAMLLMIFQMLRGGAWVYAAIQAVAAMVLCASMLYARAPASRDWIAGLIAVQILIFFSAPVVSGSLFAVSTMDDRNVPGDSRIVDATMGGRGQVYVEHAGYATAAGKPFPPEIWGIYERYTQGEVSAEEVERFFRQRNYSRIIAYKRHRYLPIEDYLEREYRKIDTFERRDMLLHGEAWEVYEWTG